MIFSALAIVAVLGLTIWLTRVKPPCGCPYIERVQGRWPLPPVPMEEREEAWKQKYRHVPLETRIAPAGEFTGVQPQASYRKTEVRNGY